MKERIQLMGTPIDNLTMNETLDIIKCAIEQKEHIHHTVVNAGKIVSMHSNAQLKESVINADIINADGQAVVWASKLFGTPLKERVAGIDLMSRLVKLAFENQYKIFFLGARQNVLDELVSRYSRQYSPDIIAGYRNGYFKKEDEEEIARQIGNSKAHMLFVAITSPIKENFLYENREVLKNVNFTMGVGGSFDVVAGYVKRAPLWMQRSGLEWLFRVYQEPRRMFKRYLVGNFKFMQLLIKYKLSRKSHTSA